MLPLLARLALMSVIGAGTGKMVNDQYGSQIKRGVQKTTSPLLRLLQNRLNTQRNFRSNLYQTDPAYSRGMYQDQLRNNPYLAAPQPPKPPKMPMY